ncbi:MAG: tRNA (guanosine(37)-N1)-methyltransferase TrmD [Firmicutes bacterium]|nr:tRNA (guanosine(37)-N1)-methyltransferase TrmD [Ezakiella sp.]MDD7762112.1 tRNA (guanosine(37)-N1)-methyltransferase TrmD [Bacillota bacterium]
MVINCLTTFPEFISSIRDYSMIKRAVDDNKVELNIVNLRDYSKDPNRRTDDYPYGGGTGMLMTCEPIVDALDSLKNKGKVIYLSPAGRSLDQELLNELKEEENLTFICGHYEGIDYRIVEEYVDLEISIGDYVVSGGEIPFMIIVDGISRLLPGVLASNISYEEESFYSGLLEHPQYTRPYDFRGLKVPDILLSGDHEKIRLYNLRKSLELTKNKRPDLYEKYIKENDNKDIKKILDRKEEEE